MATKPKVDKQHVDMIHVHLNNDGTWSYKVHVFNGSEVHVHNKKFPSQVEAEHDARTTYPDDPRNIRDSIRWMIDSAE